MVLDYNASLASSFSSQAKNPTVPIMARLTGIGPVFGQFGLQMMREITFCKVLIATNHVAPTLKCDMLHVAFHESRESAVGAR